MQNLKGLAVVLSLWPTVLAVSSASLQIQGLQRDGLLSWNNASTNAIITVERSVTLTEPWLPQKNMFSTNSFGSMRLDISEAADSFFRLCQVDVSATPQGFTNLVYAYGALETVAGNGFGRLDTVSYWQPAFEGGSAQQASLSRPHFAMADRAGNIYIADKNSHSILKVTPDGTIHTFAGTHTAGFNGDGPAEANTLQLNYPNGEWVRGDGTVYILDANNGKVRRVDTNGIMTTLFTDAAGIPTGRGLWVRDDEALAYYCAGTKVREWSLALGTRNLATGFTELGDLIVDPEGNVIVADRGANILYRVSPAGTRTPIAGNGTTSGGGDGSLALETGLYGVRAPWLLPNGAFLVGTHDGSQVWYLDSGGTIRLFLNGAKSAHSGDGSFFYSSIQRVSEPRSITTDYEGNILIVESDYGFVRRIRFQRLAPWIEETDRRPSLVNR